MLESLFHFPSTQRPSDESDSSCNVLRCLQFCSAESLKSYRRRGWIRQHLLEVRPLGVGVTQVMIFITLERARIR